MSGESQYELDSVGRETCYGNGQNQCQFLVNEDCYHEDAFIPDDDMVDDALTVDKCLDHCRSGTQSYAYAAITNGSRCGCTNQAIDLTLEYWFSNCNSECPGQENSHGLCGGYTYISFWTIYVL